AAVCRAPPATGGCGLVVLPTGRTEELMPTLTALLPALRHDPGLAELVEAVPARGALDIAAPVGGRPAVPPGLAPRAARPPRAAPSTSPPPSACGPPSSPSWRPAATARWSS